MTQRVTITAKIVAVKAMPPPLPKRPVVMKMMLLLEGGQRCWTTVPKNLLELDGYRLKYSTIRVTVDMDPDDKNFQFLRNPRKAKVLEFYKKKGSAPEPARKSRAAADVVEAYRLLFNESEAA